MSSITVSSGETFRLNKPLTSSDTVTIEPGGLLVANRLSFVASAGDILLQHGLGSEPGGALEIRHVEPVDHTDFFPNGLLTLDFVDGTSTTLNTLGTINDGGQHPFQVSGSGDFFLAPTSGFALPHNAHSVPTNFFV